MTVSNNLEIIEYLLANSSESPESISELRSWKGGWIELSRNWETPIDRALAGGLGGDRPSWAFVSGYQGAIQSIADSYGLNTTLELGAICITEKDGAHPGSIRSRLEMSPHRQGNCRLDGKKTFITGAGEADILWVAASTGKAPSGRNQLRMVRVPVGADGVTLYPMRPLGLVTEVPHAQVSLDSVIINEKDILPGDGYINCVKPFRTLEDIHVTASFLAWLFGVGRRARWPEGILETMLALVVSLRTLALAPPSAPHVHISLGGVLGRMHRLLEETEDLWDDVDSVTRELWQRDKKVLEIAGAARKKRLSTAWGKYS